MDRMHSSFRTSVMPLNEEASLGILKHLNKDELQKLLDDENKLEELIYDDPQVKQLDITKENVMTSNKSIAEYNLSQEPKLASAKQELANAYEVFVKVQKKYEELKQKYDVRSSQYSLDTLCALLQAEAATSDEESEKIAEDFLDGCMEVDAFLEKFISKRTEAHQRKVKSEKLVELLQTGSMNAGSNLTTSTPGYNQVGAAPYQTEFSTTWNLPYPAGSVAMPDARNYLPQ